MWAKPWVKALPDDYVRVDYIHHDKYASLGEGTLCRCPLASLPECDRIALVDESGRWALKHLPSGFR
jgi:hypothetical protein